MGLRYENLDQEVRTLMSREIQSDVAARTVYLSNYLNEQGCQKWPVLLQVAAATGSDDTLADALRLQQCFKSHVERRKPKGGFTTAAVPITAALTLAESQFNMYFMRALALKAINLFLNLKVYRAKAVDAPRPTSEAMIGEVFDPNVVLRLLRETKGVEPSIEIPLPNSGLTVALTEMKPTFGVAKVS